MITKINWIASNFFWPKHDNLKNADHFYFQQDEVPPNRKKEVQKCKLFVNKNNNISVKISCKK